MKTFHSTRAQTSIRLRARYLIVVKGFSQKEAAEIVGVSKKTMNDWYKYYEWADDETKHVKRKGGLAVYMKDFFEYVRSTSPELLKSVNSLWNGFLKAHEKDIG